MQIIAIISTQLYVAKILHRPQIHPSFDYVTHLAKK